jgi:hypothetical protein
MFSVGRADAEYVTGTAQFNVHADFSHLLLVVH